MDNSKQRRKNESPSLEVTFHGCYTRLPLDKTISFTASGHATVYLRSVSILYIYGCAARRDGP